MATKVMDYIKREFHSQREKCPFRCNKGKSIVILCREKEGMHESKRNLGVIGERAKGENLLMDFIEDTTAPEVCFGRAL